MFEVMIALAAKELSGGFNASTGSPLLARYEKLRDPHAPDAPDSKHATYVLDLYRRFWDRARAAGFGYRESVGRLALLSRGLLAQEE